MIPNRQPRCYWATETRRQESVLREEALFEIPFPGFRVGLGFRVDLGVSQNEGYLYKGPNNKDYSILGSILGSPYFPEP